MEDERFQQLVKTVDDLGAEHGRNAARWWEQDAIGGRATGDCSAVARGTLAGMDDGDPAILDDFPQPLPEEALKENDLLPGGLTAEQREELLSTYSAQYEMTRDGLIGGMCEAYLTLAS